MRILGTDLLRVDGPAKIRGLAQYTAWTYGAARCGTYAEVLAAVRELAG